jgi:hypothetical protein
VQAGTAVNSFSWGKHGRAGWELALIRTISLVPEEHALAPRCLELTRARLRGFDDVALAPDPSGPRIDARAWTSPSANFFEFDSAVLDTDPTALIIAGPAELLPQVALEVLTRYQSLQDRRNASSRTPQFDALLALHRDMHPLSKPLVRADFAHALDTWQWTLRLAHQASFEVQSAALFHDVERLVSECDARIEQHATDYQGFKDAHARAGSAVLLEVLGAVGVEPSRAVRACWLVAHHERQSGDEELALLNDADALSFFSLNAFGYLNYFGRAQTKMKVAYTLARLRPHARARLREVRLPGPVREMLAAAGGGA